MKLRIVTVLVLFVVVAAVPATVHAGTKAFRHALAHRINHYRATHGLGPLHVKVHLHESAQAHSADMARHHMLSHSASTGASWITRIRYWGYRGTYIGEDLAVSGLSARAVMRMWRASSEHRANLLSARYRAVGLGAKMGSWSGRAAVYVTADFGGS
ncbi:MAG TPA: CAP domain-containing protein [Gaiellales bacterium]|nr:CAP domain-containing protein [Gaiellales bacterium]